MGTSPTGGAVSSRGTSVGSHQSVTWTVMLIAADQALGQTLALLATFLGIGVVVNLLIVYIVAQVLAERKQNREHQTGL